jgi:hypothetical protein
MKMNNNNNKKVVLFKKIYEKNYIIPNYYTMSLQNVNYAVTDNLYEIIIFAFLIKFNLVQELM